MSRSSPGSERGQDKHKQKHCNLEQQVGQQYKIYLGFRLVTCKMGIIYFCGGHRHSSPSEWPGRAFER